MPKYLAFFTLMPHTLDLMSLAIIRTGSIFSGFAGINMWRNFSAGWDASTLDHVCFLPMADDGTLGFVDPDDVLHGCHIIPQFSHGLRHLDGTGISCCAQDSLDWHFYYVNRFVFYWRNPGSWVPDR